MLIDISWLRKPSLVCNVIKKLLFTTSTLMEKTPKMTWHTVTPRSANDPDNMHEQTGYFSEQWRHIFCTMPAQLLQAKSQLRRTWVCVMFQGHALYGPPFKGTNIPRQHTDFKKECSYFSENSKFKGWVYSFFKAIKGLSMKPVREGDQTSRAKTNLPSSFSHSGSKLFKENTWRFLVFQTLKNKF